MSAKQQCVPLLCKETVVLNNLSHALVFPQVSVSNVARKDNSEPAFSLTLGSVLDLEFISDVRSVPDSLVGLPATVPIYSGNNYFLFSNFLSQISLLFLRIHALP